MRIKSGGPDSLFGSKGLGDGGMDIAVPDFQCSTWVSIHSCIYILGCGLGHKLIQDLYTVKHHASIGLVSYNFHFQNGKKKKQL